MEYKDITFLIKKHVFEKDEAIFIECLLISIK